MARNLYDVTQSADIEKTARYLSDLISKEPDLRFCTDTIELVLSDFANQVRDEILRHGHSQ